MLVPLDTSKVESGDVKGYLRFLNTGNYRTVGDGLVMLAEREECMESERGRGAQTKPGAALVTDPRRIRGLTAVSGTGHMEPDMSSTSGSRQLEILEDWPQLLSLFGAPLMRASLRDAFFAILGTASRADGGGAQKIHKN